MNKLNQILSAMSCWMELERSGAKKKGLQGIRETVCLTLSALPFLLILVFGILTGWVEIPTYMGDGCSYDHFDHKKRK